MAVPKEKGKEEEFKFKQSFFQALYKMDVSNKVSARISAVKEMDKLIESRIQGFLKTQNLIVGAFSGLIGNSGSNSSSSMKRVYDWNQASKTKVDYPACLSTILVKIQDLIQNKELDKKQRQEVDNIVLLCFQQQKCLIFKLPFFMLNFIEQNLEVKDKLQFLKFLTNDGLEIDGVFNSKLFIILAKMLDPQLKFSCIDTLQYLRNIFDYNPKVFTEFQTLSLLIRMSLVSISGLNNNQSDHSLEVLQILQYLIKYNDYSQKLLNISLLTICILATREPMNSPAWNIVRLLIWQNPRQIIQELIEILNIGDVQYTSINNYNNNQQSPSKNPENQQQQVLSNIGKEIQYKCFKDNNNQLIMELEDLDQSHPIKLSNCNNKLSLQELLCQNQCSHKYLHPSQADEIIKLERSQYSLYEKLYLPNFLKILEIDRTQLVKTFEKHLDRVKKGAIYFISMALWGNEALDTYKYPFNQILKMFKNLAKQSIKFNILNHIMVAVKELIVKKHNELYLAWDTILDILEILSKSQEQFIKKKKAETIVEIFRYIRNDLLLGTFAGDEGRALKIYQIYRQGGTVNCKTLSSLYIDYCFTNDFMNTLSPLLEQCLINEKNSEFRLLFLEKLQDFYEGQEDIQNMCIVESIFSNVLEHFFIPISPLTNQYQTFSNGQQMQIIDTLSYMAHKTQKMSNFKHIISILIECINFCEIDRNLLPTPQESQSIVQVNRLKLALQNAQNYEQLKIKSQQTHALQRLIQLFKMKAQSIEFEKAIFIYNSLISVMKFSINDRRTIICDELLKHIRINVNREVCWEQEDNPLFVNIYNIQFPSEVIYNIDQIEGRESNQSQGSSGNSVSPAGISSYLQIREIGSLLGDRPQQKVQLDEQISILTTLQALILCVEDSNSSLDLKRNCLKVFQRFVIFLQESDLQIPIENESEVILNVGITVKEWYRLLEILLVCYQPNYDQEMAFLILDIFYSLLGMQDYSQATPILNKFLHTAVLEMFIKTIEQGVEYILNGQFETRESSQLEQSQKQGSQAVIGGGMSIGGKSINPAKAKNFQAKLAKSFSTSPETMGLFQGATFPENLFEQDDPKVKQALKMCKKAISLLGFTFNFDILDGSSIWFEQVQVMHNSNQLKDEGKIKLINYLIEQFMVICLNEQLMSRLSHYINICISNIIKALNRFKDKMFDQILIDYLIFICLKIGFSNVLDNKVISDPIERKKQGLHVMNLSLRFLFRAHFGIDEQKLQFDHYFINEEYMAFNMHSIIYNLSELYEMSIQEDNLRFVQTLFDQRGFLLKDYLKKQKNEPNNPIQNYQFLIDNVISTISQLLIWQAHSNYDRECTLKLYYNPSKSKFHHFLWNKNLITVLNKHQEFEVIIRNPVYNFRSQIRTVNKVFQKNQVGNSDTTYIKQILSGGIGNQSMKEMKEEDQSQNNNISMHQQNQQQNQIDEITKALLNDITIMGMLDPTLLNGAKINKDFIYFEDSDTIRNQINFLDTIGPKDIHKFGIIFIPKNAKIKDLNTFKDLFKIKIEEKMISENHMKFISCLGRICQAKDYPEYLESSYQLELQDSHIIVNQDQLSFVTYFSNILLKGGLNERFLSNLFEKVWIIYNESTIECFSHLSNDKIFLVITRIKQGYFRLEVQHNRSNNFNFQNFEQIQNSTNRYRQSSFMAPTDQMKMNKYNKTQTTTSEQEFIQNSSERYSQNQTLGQQQLQQQLQQQQQQIMEGYAEEEEYKSFKFNNGHLCSQVIVKEEYFGVFLKNFLILNDILERKQRFGKDALCSNILARSFKIHEIKEKIGRSGQNISILKTS